MAPLLGVLTPLQVMNDIVLRFGRGVAVFAMVMMVAAILIQVFFRYVLNNALPWPDEAARFMMLWMTGLIAASAYRRGGFVAIDMVESLMSRRVAALLSLALLFLSLLVLVIGLKLGWSHVNGGWLFNSASLKLPLEVIGYGVVRIKLAWMYLSLFVGLVLLTSVNIELILRSIITLGGRGDDLRPIPGDDVQGAE